VARDRVISAWARWLRPPALALLLAGCVGTTSSLPIDTVSDLAGEWQGLAAGTRGRAVARIVIQPDGAYAGSLYFDDGDRPIQGRIVLLRWTPPRYNGLDSAGTVTLRHQPDGVRILTFVPDGGGGRTELTEIKPRP
jgi:hypothetical protein